MAGARRKPAASRVSDDTLLDAARRCVLAVGVRRTTLTEIARTAKVSRMTLYRRFPDVTSVLSALMTREFGALLRAAAEHAAEEPNARARFVTTAATAVSSLAGDPLFRTLLEIDPELVLPYMVRRLGATQRFAEQIIEQLIASGHQDGSIRRADTAAQTRSLLLVVQSFVFSLRPATSDVDKDALLGEFRHLLDSVLAP